MREPQEAELCLLLEPNPARPKLPGRGTTNLFADATSRGPVMDTQHSPSKGHPAIALIGDVVVPLALFYGLRGAGVGIYLTLVMAALFPAALATYRLIRKRQLDGLAIFMITTLLLNTAASVISGSPRLLLAREAWLTGITGIWFLVSSWTNRPMAYLYTRPLLEGRGRIGPVGVSWDTLWREIPRFRRIWRVSTVLWGLGLLADCAIRIIMAYTLPLDVVPGLNTALYGATTLALIVITNVYYIASGLYSQQSAMYASLATAASGHPDAEN